MPAALAVNGVLVVATSRDQKKGTDAARELGDYGLSDLVVYHQLDVMILVVLLGFLISSRGTSIFWSVTRPFLLIMPVTFCCCEATQRGCSQLRMRMTYLCFEQVNNVHPHLLQNAYTKMMLAKAYPDLYINSVCPGTDMTLLHMGHIYYDLGFNVLAANGLLLVNTPNSLSTQPRLVSFD